MRALSNVSVGRSVYTLCEIDSKLSVVYMKIVIGHPPNYAAVVERFPEAGRLKGVYFCYGDTIFNPDNVPIPEAVLVHEQVHSIRQGDFPGGPVMWWTNYLADPAFRLAEELPAHVAEYRWYRDRIKDRNKLCVRLMEIAGRLASPLYGNMISLGDAVRSVRTGIMA